MQDKKVGIDNIGAILRLARKRAGLQLYEVSLVLHSDRAYISRLENGKFSPSWSTILNYLRGLRISPLYFLCLLIRLALYDEESTKNVPVGVLLKLKEAATEFTLTYTQPTRKVLDVLSELIEAGKTIK